MYDSACEQCKLYDAGREAGATQVALQAGYCWHWKVTLALDGLCRPRSGYAGIGEDMCLRRK